MTQPTKIHLHKVSRQLELAFDDGSSAILDAEYLRVHSPSAEVRGHTPAQAQLVFGKKTVVINSLHAVGNYAIKIVFDDGHDTGLYTWQYLHELCVKHDEYWNEYLAKLNAAGKTREPPADIFKPA